MKRMKQLLFGTVLTASSILIFGARDAFAAETYTVQAGDTLSGISEKFAGDNSLVENIATTNNIDNIHLIYVGQELTINDDGSVVVPATTTPAATAPVVEEVAAAPVAPVEATSYVGTESAAKEWIAQRESGGSYTAQNGIYIGRYQLTNTYLNGDYSAENQERVADAYVAGRYGSWENAQAFWLANGWY